MSCIRLRIEELEKTVLAERAAKASETRGRARPEVECEIRTAYQRDRDRIIHCKAFRRLKHKTQVFISPEGDHYRTRLTHTLEVAQIARTVARALRLNEDLTEAIALGHDLGHPPFGHSGEEALDEVWNPPGFRHNEQSLRVVEILEQRSEEYPGLNLTWEVRDGILNHTGRSPKPATLEGQTVRLADRIAYLNHDVDDAVRAGILKEENLPEQVRDVLGGTASKRIDHLVKDVIFQSADSHEITMSAAVADAMTDLRQYMFQQVYVGSAAKVEEGKAKRLLQALFYSYVDESRDARSAVDFVAGMTDRYAVAEYERHFMPSAWVR